MAERGGPLAAAAAALAASPRPLSRGLRRGGGSSGSATAAARLARGSAARRRGGRASVAAAAAAALLLAAVGAALAGPLAANPAAAFASTPSPRSATRPTPGGLVLLRRPGRVQLRAGVTEGDAFKAARERIRRIQLGLKPDDPLPPEGEEAEASEPTSVPQAKSKTPDLELAGTDLSEEEDAPQQPVVVKVTDSMGTTDAADAAAEAEKKAAEEAAEEIEEQTDAFAGRAEDVEELKPEKSGKKDEGPGMISLLISDLGVISWPSVGEVAQTFGIVLLLVGLYTGFIAVVDYGAQGVLGQVFQDFYKAMKPEEAQ